MNAHLLYVEARPSEHGPESCGYKYSVHNSKRNKGGLSIDYECYDSSCMRRESIGVRATGKHVQYYIAKYEKIGTPFFVFQGRITKIGALLLFYYN